MDSELLTLFRTYITKHKKAYELLSEPLARAGYTEEPKDLNEFIEYLDYIDSCSDDSAEYKLALHIIKKFINGSTNAILGTNFLKLHDRGIIHYIVSDTSSGKKEIRQFDAGRIFRQLSDIAVRFPENRSSMGRTGFLYFERLNDMLILLGNRNAKKAKNIYSERSENGDMFVLYKDIIEDMFRIVSLNMELLSTDEEDEPESDSKTINADKSRLAQIFCNIVNTREFNDFMFMFEFKTMEKEHIVLVIRNLLPVIDTIMKKYSTDTTSMLFRGLNAIRNQSEDLIRLLAADNRTIDDVGWQKDIFKFVKSLVAELNDALPEFNWLFKHILNMTVDQAIELFNSKKKLFKSAPDLIGGGEQAEEIIRQLSTVGTKTTVPSGVKAKKVIK